MRVVFQHIGEGSVVPQPHTRLVAMVWGVLRLECGLQRLNLHDVMQHRKAQQRHDAIHTGAAAISVSATAGTIEELSEPCPVHVLEESGLTLLVGHVHKVLPADALLRGLAGLPVLVDAIGEAQGSILVETHQPVDCEHGAHHALVDPFVRHPRRCPHDHLRVSPDKAQLDLGEAADAIVKVLSERVVWIGDALRYPADRLHVGAVAHHGSAEDLVRHPVFVRA
mmetsp:Transcript_102975/g.266267  ORF Transcript_102975/g.266267 Transcript_102975/m.266267 type:complete len:224 (-) Transcript_102975:768-1439(-)